MSFQLLPKWVISRIIANERRKVSRLWNRVLPVGDYFSDRWEKASFLGFGPGTSIYDNVLVLGDVTVGANTWIGPNTILDGSGRLVIGDNCSISAGVQIYSHDTVQWSISGGISEIEYSPTFIESNVYLGPNVVVQRGVRIGKGSIIGANSLVNGDIPPDSRAWGNPCKVFLN